MADPTTTAAAVLPPAQAAPAQPQAHFTTTDPAADQYAMRMKEKEMDLESGWLGRVFGSGDRAPMNIAGLAVVMLLAIGVTATIREGGPASGETWKYVAPIITGALGFTFGKRT